MILVAGSTGLIGSACDGRALVRNLQQSHTLLVGQHAREFHIAVDVVE